MSNQFCRWHTHNIKWNLWATINHNHWSLIIELNLIRHFSHNIAWRAFRHHNRLYSTLPISAVAIFDLLHKPVDLFFEIILKLIIWLWHFTKRALCTHHRVAHKE